MLETLIESMLVVGALYVVLGVAAAIALHASGLPRIDPGVRGAGVPFRILITPGMVALWPLLLRRWRAALRGEGHRGKADRPVNAAGLRRRHLRLAAGLAVVLPILVAAGLLARQGAPAPDPAARDLIPEPAPIGEVVKSWPEPFAGLPVTADLRSAGTERQIELAVAEDMEIPGTVLLFTPDGADREVFLGAVWGPGVRRYALPGNSAGRLRLHSVGHREEIGQMEIPSSNASRAEE